MRKTKADQLTDVVLTLFQLNGALVDWGDGFVAPEGLTSARWQMLGPWRSRASPSRPRRSAHAWVSPARAHRSSSTCSRSRA
ncbi:hypothetical protein [Paenacidovorax monticola]|uniref:hypothetical protein n=1 Tax=Paenacidovorax monticola TaxID=1926868 RepID=UPI001FEBBB79|nr:hypothetical protein [Paenacidovorax monticola]